MQRHLTTFLVSTAALGVLAPAHASSGPASDTLYGLTTADRIVTFSTEAPMEPTNDVAVTGLASGERLIGIDRRPKTGEMYGVGRLGSAARLYTVNPTTGSATFVADLVTAPTATGPGGTPIALSGGEFGFDFNPAADALRIVSDTGQNLRVIPSDRTPAGGVPLKTGDTFADGTLNADGATATGISAAAYTNNMAGATATTLFDIDTRRDLLVTQTPPNAGTLVTVGSLRFPAGTVAGFDIMTVGGVDTGYAALTVGRRFPLTLLARMDLASGQARIEGLAALPHALRGLAA